MNKPLSVQLYTLRDESANDFMNVLRRIAAMGYRGVEPAGLYGMDPGDFRKRVEDLGMVISSSHTPWVNPGNIAECVEIAGKLGLTMVCSGFGPDDFRTTDAIRRTADQTNEMVAALRQHGLKLFLHNHQWEFQPVDGVLAYDRFLPLVPEVLFEIDTYWASNFGANDSAEQVAKFKTRAPLLHIKDGMFVEHQPNVAVGSGKMDFPKVIAAADPEVLQWLVVELDA
ncbi:MAG: TIM barrel protein, partial [Verrucomicrobiae bacterium]|nr:TIM barrel protein [Verrucomicrobiae bacterium]